ncbi:hypothetical protein [Paraburkholderia sp. MM6662-R1]|uniref:hypothetical protein n=1 Tax=Paraburkholderia sp. MM6662-R1 TaxID=2991066 RepID=UPI003D23F703
MPCTPPNKQSGKERGWNTDNEIEFIDRLATRDAAPDLLRGYLLSLGKRTDFATLEHDSLVTHVQLRLSEVERRPS